MTAEQYWDGDPNLVIAYRKAEKLRMERRNFDAWVQGMYIYEALCEVSPLYHDLAKRGTKAAPYAKEPYPLYKTRERRQEDKAKKEMEKAQRIMEMFREHTNRRFAQKTTTPKEVMTDGCNDNRSVTDSD